MIIKNNQKNKSNHCCGLLDNMPNYDEIIKYQKNKIKIIKDAAESIGAKFKNKSRYFWRCFCF